MTSFPKQKTAALLTDELHVLPLKVQTGTNAGLMAVQERAGKK